MKIFTIGYIDHDKEVHNKYLGPSLDALEGDFDIIKTTSEKFPAENYNKMKDECKTDYLILTHQDVSFAPDLLEKIHLSLFLVDNFGAMGMVGKTKSNKQLWSSSKEIYELDTLDCCFICFRTNENVRFDEKNFGEYHLYVEDFCAQLNRLHGKKIYTIKTDSCSRLRQPSCGMLSHHGATYVNRGSCWGRYKEFKQLLLKKWPDIKTT